MKHETNDSNLGQLKRMDGLRAARLVSRFPYRTIALNYNTSESSARRALEIKSKRFEHLFKKEEDFGIVEVAKQSYSNNELDYPAIFKEKRIFTREGVISFDGNNPLVEHKNELSEVTRNYIHTMNINNIKIRTHA
ncbi:hypothetical protein N8Z08_02070 [bacterium]|nr:hypothetical protein [bacterium]